MDNSTSSSSSGSLSGENILAGQDGGSNPSSDGKGARLSEIRETAKDLGRQAKDQAKETIADAKDQIASAAEPLKDNARDFAEQKKRQGAARIKDLAKAVHGAADEVGKEVPKAAKYIHAGAGRLEGASDMLSSKNLDQLLGDANRIAHDRPLSFFAGSLAAGFLFARFLRSSAGGKERSHG